MKIIGTRFQLRSLTWLSALLAIGLHAPAPAENQLSGQLSPHLRDYADSAVDWRPWGDEAFAEAAEKDRMVFAAIGFDASHQSAVLKRTCFEDPAIADELNRQYVNVKVDRLQRPDLDLALRFYASVTGIRPTLPVCVWFTADGHPLSAGNFDETASGGGKSQFQTAVSHIGGQWKKHRDYVKTQAKRDAEALRSKVRQPALAELEQIDSDSNLDVYYIAISSNFDPSYGSFEPSSKLPRPSILESLPALARREKPGSFRWRQIDKMLRRTIDSMLGGAIIDPLDGGIFQFTLDAQWRVPSTERLLPDQVRFASALINAYQATGDARYADAARRMLEFAGTALRDDSGLFVASLAGGSPPAPGEPPALGAYYLWTTDELGKILDAEELAAAESAFGIQERGNITAAGRLERFPRNSNFLYAATRDARAPEPGTALAKAVEKMRAARAKRPPPRRDASAIVAQNGLAISALARAAAVLGDTAYTRQAEQTAQAVRIGMYKDEAGERRLARGSVSGKVFGEGFAEDYIFLARGMLDLYRAGGDPGSLQFAIELQSIADEQFFDRDTGLYHLTPIARADELSLPLLPIVDGQMPSANATAALNLLDLAAVDGSESRRERAAGIVTAIAASARGKLISFPTTAVAMDRLSKPALQAIVSGPPGDPLADQLVAELRQHAPPEVTILHMDGAAGEEALLALRPALKEFRAPSSGAKVVLCRDLEVRETISDPKDFKSALETFTSRAE